MNEKILMPRLGVNDDFVTLTKFLVLNGSRVRKGQEIAVIETSKETSEVKAVCDGIISFMVKEGEEIQVGKIIAEIGEDNVEIHEEQKNISEYKLTEKARELVEKLGIDYSMLPKGKIIREKDLEKFISKPYSIEPRTDNQILLYGGGGFAESALDILRNQAIFRVYGILDSNYPEKNEVFGYPVLGDDDTLAELFRKGYRKIVNTVGFYQKAHWRKPPYDMLKNIGFEFVNVIHRSAVIEQSASIGVGNLVFAGAVIGSDAQIGNNCIINTSSVVSHGCIISDSCHIASGAVLASNVVVGENTLIGQNCTVYSDVKIGKNVVIQNGANIFKNVEDGKIVMLNDQRENRS